jgi:hypothetical protein
MAWMEPHKWGISSILAFFSFAERRNRKSPSFEVAAVRIFWCYFFLIVGGIACKSEKGKLIEPLAASKSVQADSYFSLAPTLTPFDAGTFLPVPYTVHAITQGSQTGFEISLPTIDPNSDFFRLSICADAGCEHSPVIQEFSVGTWDYYPQPGMEGVLTLQLAACINPQRAVDPHVTCGPSQNEVWNQVANPADEQSKTIQVFQNSIGALQQDCQKARDLIAAYIEATPTPPTDSQGLEFYNMLQGFSFLDPHACTTLLQNGTLWAFDGAVEPPASSPATTSSSLKDHGDDSGSTLGVSDSTWLLAGAGVAGVVSLLSFAGAIKSGLSWRQSVLFQRGVKIKLQVQSIVLGAINKASTFGEVRENLFKKIDSLEKGKDPARKKLIQELHTAGAELDDIYPNESHTDPAEEKKAFKERKSLLIDFARTNLDIQLGFETRPGIEAGKPLSDVPVSITETPHVKAGKPAIISVKTNPAEIVPKARSGVKTVALGFGGVLAAAAAITSGVFSTQFLAASTANVSQQDVLTQLAAVRVQMDADMNAYLATYTDAFP